MTRRKNFTSAYWTLFLVSAAALLIALLVDMLRTWGAMNSEEFLGFLSPPYRANSFAPVMYVLDTFSQVWKVAAWTCIYIIALQYRLLPYGPVTAMVLVYHFLQNYLLRLFYVFPSRLLPPMPYWRYMLNMVLLPVLSMVVWFGVAKLLMLITRRREALSFVILISLQCVLKTIGYWPALHDKSIESTARRGYIEMLVQELLQILWYVCAYAVICFCRKRWMKKQQDEQTGEAPAGEVPLPPIVI